MNDAVDRATDQLLAQGLRVLNGALLADNESDHVRELLARMEPPESAVILDAGCGVGEVARLMREQRPDLSFILLNTSAAQLYHCPADMQQVVGDYHDMPIEDASVDVVMFNYALCHTLLWERVLRQAHRVLRPGGKVFIFDMVRTEGDNRLMIPVLDAAAHPEQQVLESAERAGFILVAHEVHKAPPVERLREVLEPKFHAALDGVVPATWLFQRHESAGPVASAFDRHRRIAFQFSGGRDSTAALYLLRPYWHLMTVYHLDTGDQFPETREVVERVSRDVGITIIASDVEAVRTEHGLPSDLVPVDNTQTGRMVSGRQVKLQSRYECCYRSLMEPMQRRMVQDGITLIVRGQRDDEYDKPPLRSGDTDQGFEVLYPIQDWTGDRVSAYLAEHGLPLAPFYERGMRRAPECMGCTAWWDEGRAPYLREWHPIAFESYRERMKTVRAEIDRQLQMLEG